jgi:hypothetical protein
MLRLHPFQILAHHAVEIETLRQCKGLSINPVDLTDIQGNFVAIIDRLDPAAKGSCVTQINEAAAGGRLQWSV